MDALQGMGFGALNAELVENMWKQSYEKEYAPTMWEDARKWGIGLPEKQEHLTLKEIEEIVLTQVQEFAKENRPQLIDELGLK